MGAKTGANVLRFRPTERDPLRAFAQVRRNGPRISFAQIRAYPLDCTVILTVRSGGKSRQILLLTVTQRGSSSPIAKASSF